MKLFPQDDEVVLYETTFGDDLLERGKISQQLSDLIERIESPMVIALDDQWGAGKSYFLKRWVGAHKRDNNGKAITVYFDAFENDYLSDPMVSLISAISDRLPQTADTIVRDWKKFGKRLIRPMTGIALSLASFGMKQYFDEIGDAVTDAIAGEAKSENDAFWQAEDDRKVALESFRKLLEEITKETGSGLVVVVDELDRCRPDYALNVLEVIKHFFNVPRVHFILGVNATALENSVKARYGSDIDAEAYLRKFVNVSFSLPKVINRGQDQSLARIYALKLCKDLGVPEHLSERLVYIIDQVSRQNPISLRDIGKIISKVPLLPDDALRGNILDGWYDILCVLLVSSVSDPDFYKKLLNSKASISDILSFLSSSKLQVTYMNGDQYNPDYDRRVAYLFVEMMYCCSDHSVNEIDFVGDDISLITRQFARYSVDAKEVPKRINRDWINLFRS